jgi:hypothetical protein
MGNIDYQKMFKCCNQNEESPKVDIDVEKNKIEEHLNDNLKNVNSLKNNDDNKFEQKIIKTKSRQSSRNSSLNKSKNGVENSPPNDDRNSSTYNKTSQILNKIPSNNNRKNSNSNIMMQKKNDTLNCNNENNDKDENDIEPKTKVVLTGDLFYNNNIEVYKYGMKNGLRQKKDGMAIFGIKENIDDTDDNFCDYFLNLNNIDENNNGLTRFGKVFKIFFDSKEKMYILYFLHNSLILYYRINDYIFFDIDKNYFLILGDIFLITNVKMLDTNKKQINIETQMEKEELKQYTYSQDEAPIKIGRYDCNINIQKPSISKTHCIIHFSDGMFYYEDSKSTNGSSLLIREDDILRIKGEMFLKLEDVSFKIMEMPLEQEE